MEMQLIPMDQITSVMCYDLMDIEVINDNEWIVNFEELANQPARQYRIIQRDHILYLFNDNFIEYYKTPKQLTSRLLELNMNAGQMIHALLSEANATTVPNEPGKFMRKLLLEHFYYNIAAKCDTQGLLVALPSSVYETNEVAVMCEILDNVPNTKQIDVNALSYDTAYVDTIADIIRGI